MHVKTYSLAREGDLILSANFRVLEFACHDGADEILNSPELVTALQAIRDHFAKPVRITSGYRTKSWNRKVGGVANSQHVQGTAADINVDDETPLSLYRAINNGWVKGVDPSVIGLGLYKGFVHIDVRGHRARWFGSGVKEVTEA